MVYNTIAMNFTITWVALVEFCSIMLIISIVMLIIGIIFPFVSK